MSAEKLVAFVPARSGSQRIRGKNVRRLAGHPLIAYAIAAAIEAGIFSRVVVSTDSADYGDIAKHYGAETLLRPSQYATSSSPDIEWILHALSELGLQRGAMAIVRPTSPFRGGAALQRAWTRLQALPAIDSLRAVRKVREHPGKMWVLKADRDSMRPLQEQAHLPVAWHARQYQDLPEVYVQDSSLEIARIEAVLRTRTREGNTQAPFFPQGLEGFSLDYEDEWLAAERYVAEGKATLPAIRVAPYPEGSRG